jgi:environmental stress-induced protein Ves
MSGATMTTGTLIPATDQPLATWRGGTTRAIYAYPAETLSALAQAHFWVGTALIERDGPYSVFANRTRIHMPVRGKGLHLHFQDPTESTTLHTFDQATFAGDRPLAVTLVDGPVEAFNLIFHPSVQAHLQVLTLTAASMSIPPSHLAGSALSSPAIQVVYAVNGTCDVDAAGQTAKLQPGDAFVCAVGTALRVRSHAGQGALVVATLVA